MEGGQKNNIPLTSGLDVKSSDQLVPISSPLFQHNRQRFQGHVLPTSLRYEHNGYAAGWDVYEFEVANVSVDTSPVGFTVIKNQLNNNPTYIFQVKNGSLNVCTVYWNGVDEVRQGDLTISHDDSDYSIIRISGANGDHEFVIEINMVTGDIDYDDAEWYVVENSYSDATATSGLTEIQILDLLSWVQFNAAVVLPEDISYEGQSICAYYSCVAEGDGALHTWKSDEWDWTVTYNSNTGEVLVNDNEVVSSSLDMDNGELAVEYDEEYSDTVTVGASSESFMMQVFNVDTSQPSTEVASSTNSLTFETWSVATRGNSYLYPTIANIPRVYVCVAVPVWMGSYISITRLGADAAIDYAQVNIIDDDGNSLENISANMSVYVASLYYLSSEYVSFYEEDLFGGTASFWIQDKECLSDYATVTNSFGEKEDIYGTLTYAVCVFNRLELEENLSEDSIPFTVDMYKNCDVIEEAPWWEGGESVRNMVIAQSDEYSYFVAGFYIEAEELNVRWEPSSGGGWVLVPDDWPYLPPSWSYAWYCESESPFGEYFTWWDYNKLLLDTAEALRSNNYKEFFLQGLGDYIHKDEEDGRALEFLTSVVSGAEDSWDFYTWEEWNVAAAEWNSAHEYEINNEYIYVLIEDTLPDGETGYVIDPATGDYREPLPAEEGIYVYDPAGGYRVADTGNGEIPLYAFGDDGGFVRVWLVYDSDGGYRLTGSGETATHIWDEDSGEFREVGQDETAIYIYDSAGGYRVADVSNEEAPEYRIASDGSFEQVEAFFVWDDEGGVRLPEAGEEVSWLWDSSEGAFRGAHPAEEAHYFRNPSDWYQNPVSLLSEGKYCITQITEEESEYERLSDGWFIKGDRDSYPDSYDASKVVRDGSEFEGFVRVEEPLAYYDQEVKGASWSGARYTLSGSNNPSEVGESSLDLVIYLSRLEYTDARTENTYKLGDEAGYLAPYYITTKNISDTRSFNDLSGDITNTLKGSVAVSFTSGPFIGMSAIVDTGSSTSTRYYNLNSDEISTSILDAFVTVLNVSVSATTQGLYICQATSGVVGTYIFGSGNPYYINKGWWSVSSIFSSTLYRRIITDVLGEEYLDTSLYSVVVSIYADSIDVTRGYDNSTNKATYTFNGVYYTQLRIIIRQLSTFAQITSSSDETIKVSSDVDSDYTSNFTSYLGIAPLQVYVKTEGLGAVSSDSLKTSCNLYIAACFNGRLQSTVRLSDDEGDYFSSSGFSNIVNVETSSSNELQFSSGVYLDRDVDNSDSSAGTCTLFGLNLLNISKYSTSVTGSNVYVYMYISPVLNSSGDYDDYYMFTSTTSEEGSVFVPGPIYYNNASSVYSGYNMQGSSIGKSYSSSNLTFSLVGETVEFYKANSCYITWPSTSGFHDFYTSILPQAISVSSGTGETMGSPGHAGNGTAQAEEALRLNICGQEVLVMATFSLSGGVGTTSVTLEGEPITISYMGYDFVLKLSSYSWSSGSVSVTLRVTAIVPYSLLGRLPYQYNYNSLSYDESTGKFLVDGVEKEAVPVGALCVSYDRESFRYAFTSSEGHTYYYSANDDIFTYGVETFSYNILKDALCVGIESEEAIDLSFILEGVYRSNNCELVGFTENSVTFNYDGVEYTFRTDNLLNGEAENSISYMYTDVRDDSATPQAVTFARQDTGDSFQFLRQTWNTTIDVENYWWIDADTILELGKSVITVKKKVSSDGDDSIVDVDDWGGDMWEDAYSFPRSEYLDNTTIKYGVTCAYGGAAPRFWTIQISSSSIITLNFYELVSSGASYSLNKVSVNVSINIVSIGNTLNNSSYLRLNSYSQLSAETIVYDSSYSGTVIGEHILFGIHHDNNFNQWALDISTSGELLQVVQGYGYVGLDGSLTGGEIPSSFFDASLGFNSAVLNVEDTLEQDDITYVTNASSFQNLDANGLVVGDDSQQWYIGTSVSGIVSHLTWNGSAWESVTLNIGNNYACVYGSASFGSRVISCFDMFRESFSSLLDVDSLYDSSLRNNMRWSTLMLYGYCPKVSTMLYLQQTMGQYAYVHYNSNTPGRQKDISRENTSKDVSGFGKEGYKGAEYTAIGIQKEQESEPLDPVTPENSDDFSFNLHGIRQTLEVKDPWASGDASLAKFILLILSGLVSFGQSVTQALNPVNVLQNQSSIGDIGRKFSQSFLKNIDMMAAAQTSSVGATPTQQSAVACACTLDMFYSTCEGQKISAGPGWVNHNYVAQCVAQSVTSNQMEMSQIGMVWIMEGLSTVITRYTVWVAELAYDAVVQAAGAYSTSIGAGGLIALGANLAAMGVLSYTVGYMKQECDMVDALIASISNGAQVQVQNTLSKHVYSMEGKHKYGQKSECFMWPCFDVVNRLEYTNETVSAKAENYKWKFYVPLISSHGGSTVLNLGTINLDSSSTVTTSNDEVKNSWDGEVSYLIANCKGKKSTTTLPSDMAAVIGCESFLPPVPFRNENIGVSDPVFATPPIQDYIIDKDWELSRTATASMTLWVGCKDTKLIDGEPSNIVVSDDFCGVACPYTAIEVKRGLEQKYVRPWAITPNAIALNHTGFNVCYEEKAYHGFDGYGGRIVKWVGAPGMNKEGRAWQYAFIVNDRFKRSNKVPPNEFIGNFKGEPLIALKTVGEDKVFNHVTQPGRQKGLEAGTVGEDKDVQRYAVPVFSEFVNTLPAAVKTISSINLSVVDGITSLTTENRDLQSAYKAPVSIDFTINQDMYRFTNEYICQLEQISGVTSVRELVPTLGLEFLGSTPYEAYLYSPATRQYYTYAGGTSLTVVDMIERFRDVVHGRYDFVNQEIVMPCLATFVRLDKHVFDDEDETDNHIVPRLKNGAFVGEVAPPIETIYNTRSGFRTISLPSGACYQGPNRCIINRFVYSDYMKEQIKTNYGKWTRVPREKYHPFRDYGVAYERVDESVQSTLLGWTHNPFLLVTSPLGVNSETDCLFEWEITFAWPVEMDELYDAKQYAVVNIWAECFTPGGKVIPDRPTHVYLYKELFTRTGNYGYYSFRYQSRCGAGNRERLHIWSDQYIAVSGLRVEYKPVTEKRTEILTQQVDVQDMQEI